MELQRKSYPATEILYGTEAGKHFAVGTYHPQEFWLDEEVPAGKKWKVNVSIKVEETNA